MAEFVQLTKLDKKGGKREGIVRINPDHIGYISGDSTKKATVVMSDGQAIHVSQTGAEIEYQFKRLKIKIHDT